jgi:glycosyltransferase involved in cell wall biosynthesis
MAFPFEFPALGQWEGSRSRLVTLSRGLVERGVEVHVVSKADPSYAGTDFEGLRLHRFPSFGTRRGGRLVGALLAGRTVERLSDRYDFDVVHCHMPVVAASVALWKPLIRPRTLFDTHDWFKVRDEVFYNFPFIPPSAAGPTEWVEREIARAHDGVVVTTGLLSRAVGRRGNVFVVPNPIDTDHFKPGASVARTTLLRNPQFVVGFLGFISVHQGFWEVMEAVRIVSRSVSGVKLLAIGGGFVEEAREHSKRLGIEEKVVFTGPGRVPYAQIPDLINAMDVAVSPLQRSPAYQEYAQPLKVLEYMSCGIPFVVTPLLEQSRLASEAGSGTIARGFSGGELAEAILASRSSQDGPARRDKSRRYVLANHSVESVVRRLIGAYSTLTG